MTELAIEIFPATISALTSSISALSESGRATLIGPRPTPPFWTEKGRATGLGRPAHELLDRFEHRYVQPLHGASSAYVPAQMGLVDIDSNPPGPTLACRLQRPETAIAGDLEDDSRSLRDLAQGDRPAFHRVEVVGIAVQRRDARIGSSRACLVAGDVPLDRRHPLTADRADHLLPGESVSTSAAR